MNSGRAERGPLADATQSACALDWPAASVIYRGGDEPNLRVVDVIVLDDPERFDVLVVEPVD